MSFDLPILDYIQTHLRSGVLDFLMPVLTVFGDGGVFWILLTLALLMFKKTRRYGLAMAAGLCIEALFCNVIIKNAVARIRPYDINTSVRLLIKPPSDYSFPSGHTGASFAGASALLFSKCRKFWIPAFLLASVIAFSRLYLYVHFPTDVLAGALLGIFSGWLGSVFMSYALKSYDRRHIKKEESAGEA